MISVLHCDCGFKASGQSEDELIAAVRVHAWDVHGMALSRDDVLLLAFHAELNAEHGALAIPRDMSHPTEEEESRDNGSGTNISDRKGTT